MMPKTAAEANVSGKLNADAIFRLSSVFIYVRE